MGYSGGLRFRLIRDNFYNMIKDGLEDSGLLNSTVFKNPVKVIPEQIDVSKAVTPNTIGVSSENIESFPAETGSSFERDEWEFYVDIFAESESAGIQIFGDVQAIIRGRLASANRLEPLLRVYDLTQPSKPEIFVCDIEDVQTARVKNEDNTFNRFYWVVACTVIDHSYAEE